MSPTTGDLFPEYTQNGSVRTIPHKPVQTLQDLLEVIALLEQPKSSVRAMLRSLAGHICLYFEKPPHSIEIGRFVDLRPMLRVYLQDRGLKPTSVKAYLNFLRILLQKAKRVGWIQIPPEILREWNGVLDLVARLKGCKGIIYFAMQNGMVPSSFGDKDLESWGDELCRLGRKYDYVRSRKRVFRNTVLNSGLGHRFPMLNCSTQKGYGVRLPLLPEPLQTEILTILKWRTDTFAVGRPSKNKLRPISARHLRYFLCRLFGFLQKYTGRTVTTVCELLSKEFVNTFVAWAINERGLCTKTLETWLGMIPPLGRHPLLIGKNFVWVRELIDGLPRDGDRRQRERKAQKWVGYAKLSEIPGRLLDAARLAKNRRDKAILVRDALLVQWLLICPWRQRNLRQCRIVPSNTLPANLAFDEIPISARVSKANWVEHSLKLNPHQRFWQYEFDGEETKNGHRVHAILPKQLVKPLETYLMHFRPLLVYGKDPGTLFLNDHGKSYSLSIMSNLVGNITLKWVGRRTTPHHFRDAFAVQYLTDRPEDYLTLSKILWHRNIQTTLQIYGAGFDESHGARRTEEWLDEREAAKGTQAQKSGGGQP